MLPAPTKDINLIDPGPTKLFLIGVAPRLDLMMVRAWQDSTMPGMFAIGTRLLQENSWSKKDKAKVRLL